MNRLRVALQAFACIVGLSVFFLLLYAARELPTPAVLTGPPILTDRTWRWLPSAERIHPRAQIRVTGTLEFNSSDARLNVRTPCGNFAIRPHVVVFGRTFFTSGWAVSLRGCPDEEWAQQERRLIAGLRRTRRFAIDGCRLTLINRAGKDVLVFDTYPDP